MRTKKQELILLGSTILLFSWIVFKLLTTEY